MTHPPHLPPIGVIGLPQLAEHCARLGLDVLTAEVDELAASTIVDVTAARGPLPVIVSADAVLAARPWLEHLVRVTGVVVAGDNGTAVPPSGVTIVPLPASVAAVLAAAGISGLPDAAETLEIAATSPAGTSEVRDETQPQTTESVDVGETAVQVELSKTPAELVAELAAAPVAQSPSEPSVNASPAELAKVVISWSGKGGVGKSTFSLALARAAADAGLRVAIIDANFGQGDLRTFLRIGTAGLPSIYQAAGGNIEDAFIAPDVLNVTRSVKLEPVNFTVVQAPPPHVAGAAEITPELYLSAVEYAVKNYDLVVIDTQIIEAVDRTGMVDRFVVPLLLNGARGLAITDSSGPSISNLLTRLKVLASLGVSPAAQLTAVNRVTRLAETDIAGLAGVLADHATFVGAVYSDDSIPDATNRGRPVAGLPQLAPVLANILAHVTGTGQVTAPTITPAAGDLETGSAATPQPTAEPAAEPAPRKRLFGRRR